MVLFGLVVCCQGRFFKREKAYQKSDKIGIDRLLVIFGNEIMPFGWLAGRLTVGGDFRFQIQNF